MYGIVTIMLYGIVIILCGIAINMLYGIIITWCGIVIHLVIAGLNGKSRSDGILLSWFFLFLFQIPRNSSIPLLQPVMVMFSFSCNF